MLAIAAINFKLVQEPLVPVAGTVDLAPFLIMIALLALGAVAMRLGRGARQEAGSPQTRFDTFLALTGYIGERRQWLRRGTQTAAALAFVIGLHPCACMVRDLIRGALQINYNNVETFLYTMLIIPVAAFTMIWGRVFCGWVCPIGFIQELTSKLTYWMRGQSHSSAVRNVRFAVAAALLLGTVVAYSFIRPANEPVLHGLAAGYLIFLSILIVLRVADARWETRLRIVRYVALSIFTAATLGYVYLHFAFCVLFTNDWRRSPVMLFVGVLFASLVLSQAWCRFLCPEGALLGLLTRVSGWKIRLDRAKCSSCNTCQQVCPVESIEIGEVDERSCLYCCRCVDACPTGAIGMAGEATDRRSIMALPVIGSASQ